MPWAPPSHRNKLAKRFERHRRREQDARRGSAASRGYGAKWRKARLHFLRKHPLCVECLGEGRTVAATVVDHIKPHKGDWSLFWDRSNWQPLCKPHHDRKTAKHDGAFGRPPTRGRGG